MPDSRTWFWKTALLLGAALIVGLGIGILVFRVTRPHVPRGTPTVKREHPSPPAQGAARPEANEATATGETATPEAGEGAGLPEGVKPAVHPQSHGPTTPAPPAKEASSWEFTPDDIAAAVGRTVHITLGRYTVRPGEEFDVHVAMDAPPLQAVVLALRYDPEFVEPIPDSAASVGNTFRRGVEFFIAPRRGRMALFCATYPGKKNVLACAGGEVARFRLRARKTGSTRITADTRGLKCVAGDGSLIPVDVAPAEIVIRGGE